MRNIVIILETVLLVLLVSCAGKGKEYHVYYLGGQSNMDGYGYVKELSDELNAPVDGVMIFHGNTAKDTAEIDGRGIWATLQPGHGVRFKSDGKENVYSDRFGVELTFARKMQELFPEENVAIIKYSKGGTSIDTSATGKYGCWMPGFKAGNGVNQFDHFKATVANAMSCGDIDGDGKVDKLIPSGIVWMQGESDGTIEYAASVYKKNLAELMYQIRSTFGVTDMPVVIGRITDSHNDTDSLVWDFGDVIRDAQADFVEEDSNAALVTSTDNYSYSDPYHYNSEGYTDLGEQFALSMAALRKP